MDGPLFRGVLVQGLEGDEQIVVGEIGMVGEERAEGLKLIDGRYGGGGGGDFHLCYPCVVVCHYSMSFSDA